MNTAATNLKHRLPGILSLEAMKMEKNFIAHIEKGYGRQPYIDVDVDFLMERAQQELDELKAAVLNRDVVNMREEVADVQNILDYVYEATLQLEQQLTLKAAEGFYKDFLKFTVNPQKWIQDYGAEVVLHSPSLHSCSGVNVSDVFCFLFKQYFGGLKHCVR